MTISKFIKLHNLKSKVIEVSENKNLTWNNARHFRFTISHNGIWRHFYFSQGLGIKDTPTLEDLLNCLIVDDYYSQLAIEDFMSDMSYNSVREATKVQNAIIGNSIKLEKVLGYFVKRNLMRCDTL